uniref:Leptin n=1 Tax=Tetraodon nigroviridis TaxID=99883 RepID=LEP_TETNG|nr:RecName: Full=Leptin; Flags: Precursor [Tetraodon nigroviridis]
MDYTLALALSLLQLSMCTPVPMMQDSGRMKTKAKWMVQQLLVRLKDNVWPHFDMPPTFSADDLEGSASIVARLENFNSLISDNLGDVLQIKAEISSLTGYLNNWRHNNCKEQRPRTAVPGLPQEPQRRKDFIQSVTIDALMSMKEFLNLLLQNLDHLEIC